VGQVKPGNYAINSYYYLRKIWLRQLIISSFHHSFDFLPYYETPSLILLRWLGAYVEDDVKIADITQILRFPSNLLKLHHGVTTFGRAILAPFEIMPTVDCHIDEICLSAGANIGNVSTLMPGTRISNYSMVGNLTYITRETTNNVDGTVWMGIPARQMPFVMPSNQVSLDDNSLSSVTSPFHDFGRACLIFSISKCLFIIPYFLLPMTIAPFIHIILVCLTYRYSVSKKGTTTSFDYAALDTCTQRFLDLFLSDFDMFISPFLARTQFLVFFFRALGARIGHDVILADIECLFDPHLATIGDHVRVNTNVSIQVTTYLVFLFL
jgi:acetyltransferase-like isoleucine patch superfamily enzyme